MNVAATVPREPGCLTPLAFAAYMLPGFFETTPERVNEYWRTYNLIGINHISLGCASTLKKRLSK
jgi:hypothetical protein